MIEMIFGFLFVVVCVFILVFLPELFVKFSKTKMTKENFEKELMKNLLKIREISEQFFKENPEYDIDKDGYLSLCIYHDSVRANTVSKKNDYVNIYKRLK